MNKLWFRAKTYGWGWYPIAWQGWLVTLLFALIIAFTAINISEHGDDIVFSLIVLFLSIICLFIICYKKGEKPGWRWGEDKNNLK